MTFGVNLGIDFHEILDFVIICVNHQNAFIQSISVGSAHPKSHIFSLNFNQNFIYFLMPHSGPHFLRFWCDLVPKSSILGAPWRPAGSQMAPKIAQVAPKGRCTHLYAPPPGGSWNRPASKIAFRTFLITISLDFGRISIPFSIFFQF